MSILHAAKALTPDGWKSDVRVAIADSAIVAAFKDGAVSVRNAAVGTVTWRPVSGVLPALGVPDCPPLESYVDKLVEYVQERVRQRRATRKADAEIEDPLG